MSGYQLAVCPCCNQHLLLLRRHLPKCFDNVHNLEFRKDEAGDPSKGAIGMYSGKPLLPLGMLTCMRLTVHATNNLVQAAEEGYMLQHLILCMLALLSP